MELRNKEKRICIIIKVLPREWNFLQEKVKGKHGNVRKQHCES